MKPILKVVLIVLCSLNFINTNAETWNEPWQKEIIQKSDYLVLGEVLDADNKAVKVKVIKGFGDNKTADEITIDGFFLLTLTSSSGRGVHFNLEAGKKYYLFLKKNDTGNYSLPTPTSGYAYVDDEQNVIATYRHSYHQALVSQDIYELTYQNIWSYYKKKKYNPAEITAFINTHLEIKPSGLEEEEINEFFLQHAALETAYLLDLSPDFKKVDKFTSCENFHLRVSALQLLGNNRTSDSKELLLKSIKSEHHSDFEKVIAIWSLERIGDKAYISKLKKMQNELSDEDGGFGGNIMDPRVGTYFPSPRGAVSSL